MLDMFLHLDKYLQLVVAEYSTITYLILFFVLFTETGVVIMPFLPGDTLIFAAGALAITGDLNIGILFIILFAAAVLGDTLNYHIGKFIGPKIFNRKSSMFFNTKYLLRAQNFYNEYGKKTIILARFIPIIRTFAPFVAGIGSMRYGVFLAYNAIGAALWTGLFLFGGYLFGNIPWVQAHFGIIVLGIIFVSLIPLIKEVIRFFMRKPTS